MLKGAVLYAKNLENLTQFYLQIGGQITDEGKGEFSAISNGGTELIILQTPSEVASQIVIDDPPAIRSATPLKPILETSSIEDVLHDIFKFGGRPVPGAKRWKFRKYLVQDIVDPEGNVVQLWQSE
ncbi:hypothetical protein [Roseibium sp.]|uniref:hypothetical protein n=1 Tax=Roseibium sp. TaxID=1936156 RepID=UPI003B512944